MRADGIGPCAGCNGSCCYQYVVPVTGYDAWLIASALHLRLEQFLVVLAEPEPTPTGFRLDPTATTFSLALNKRAARGPKKPCIFLLELPDGYARCGIYTHRPLVCKAFPATLVHGSVALRDDVLCASAGDVMATNLPACRETLIRSDVESAIYVRVVQRWNEAVKPNKPDAGYLLPLYFAYLMNVYTRLEGVREGVHGGMAHMARTWGQGGRDDRPGAPRDFLERVDKVVTDVGTSLAGAAL